MNWEQFKIEYKDYIVTVSNKKKGNETLTFWNGYMVMKYNFNFYKKFIIKRIQRPITLIEYRGTISQGKTIIGYEWPLKSKLNYESCKF